MEGTGCGVRRHHARIGIILVCVMALAMLTPLAFSGERRTYDAKSLYLRAGDAVFYIRTLNANGQLKSTATGFLVSPEGLAYTATHVVAGASEVQVILPSGETYEQIPVLIADSGTDIAMLRLPARTEPYPYLPVEEGTALRGEDAYAIGYALKAVKLLHDGIVSAPDAPINSIPRLLITTQLASGMSGGPILSGYGTVIGIASATVRTMNGVSASPTTAQLWAAAEACGYAAELRGASGAAAAEANAAAETVVSTQTP